MGTHLFIEREARAVAAGDQAPRNPVSDPAPGISPEVLVGIDPTTLQVSGYESGTAHRGTFYREAEGITAYPDEPFVRVVRYGDEFHDVETRVPIAML